MVRGMGGWVWGISSQGAPYGVFLVGSEGEVNGGDDRYISGMGWDD